MLYQEIQIQIAFWDIICNSFNFSWVFKYYLMLTWNKSYEIIILSMTLRKILCESYYVLYFLMWPTFGDSSVFMREVHFFKNLIRKTTFLRSDLSSNSIIWNWHEISPWNFLNFPTFWIEITCLSTFLYFFIKLTFYQTVYLAKFIKHLLMHSATVL